MEVHAGLVLLLLPLLPVLLLIILTEKHKKKQEGPKSRLPPGPPRLPIIGNIHQLGKHPQRALWELSKQHGPLMHLQLGSVPVVVISSAEMAERVLKTHDLQCCSRPAHISWKRLSYGFSDVVFSPYSAAWRELRKICVLRLLNPKRVEGFRPVRKEEVERMVASISCSSSLSEPIDLSSILHSLSSNIICRVAFGKGFHGEEERGDHVQARFYRILSESQALFAGFFAGDYFPWAGWADRVLSGLHARLEKNFRELDTVYKQVIAAHEGPTRRPAEDEDIVDVLLRLQKEDAWLTEDHVKGLLMDIFIAGTDTSSATLEFAMVELMRNPSIMLRAQKEARMAVGAKGMVEESDIPQLHYLKLVVKETLRLHPVAPLVYRETIGHVNIDGYDILPKTRVFVNVWAIGRESRFWDEPHKFIPERFTDNTVDFKGHDFQLIPFGAGRRICPGLMFGIMTVELALANLLYGFNWELPDGMMEKGIDMEEATGITVHLKSGVQLKATKYVPHMGTSMR